MLRVILFLALCVLALGLTDQAEARLFGRLRARRAAASACASASSSGGCASCAAGSCPAACVGSSCANGVCIVPAAAPPKPAASVPQKTP